MDGGMDPPPAAREDTEIAAALGHGELGRGAPGLVLGGVGLVGEGDGALGLDHGGLGRGSPVLCLGAPYDGADGQTAGGRGGRGATPAGLGHAIPSQTSVERRSFLTSLMRWGWNDVDNTVGGGPEVEEVSPSIGNAKRRSRIVLDKAKKPKSGTTRVIQEQITNIAE